MGFYFTLRFKEWFAVVLYYVLKVLKGLAFPLLASSTNVIAKLPHRYPTL